MTCGLYLIDYFMCSCLRDINIWTVRAKLVITNKNRIGIWRSSTTGTKGPPGFCKCLFGCISDCWKFKFTSATSITWYKSSDISHIQYMNDERNVMRLFCCFPKTFWMSSLMVSFRSYPKQARYLMTNAELGLPGSVCVSSGFSARKSSQYFAAASFLLRPSAYVTDTLETLFDFNDHVIEIVSSRHDTNHHQKNSCRDELIKLQRELTSLIDGHPQILEKPTGFVAPKIEFAAITKDLFSKDRVRFDKNLTPLFEGEEILAALPTKPSLTWLDLFWCFLSLGLYWLFHLQYRLKFRSALIITSHRFMELSTMYLPSFCSLNGKP